ncbi:hypothetical protein J2Z76_000936 [Sedimentibacter acidaminivorans]|uniref:Zinc-finger domain-containing protein n=1 Tax=Sedimentibacter acidaminivorans TaxID=913099 RepID=A0ABS4GBL1_9FIRM|nr:hypothetical protein [Sedimentibacter acidaminivorans]MBP1925079.1 hypothetical protein [Sedimentibacter acidaminivorans]
MKHYDYIEWLLYKNKMLTKEKLDEMEQHLFNCDTCMEIFLTLIDEEEVRSAGKFVTNNFTSNVIEKMPKLKIVKHKKKQKKKIFNYQFGYYVAVASVTIILTFGGFYTDLVDIVPKLSASIKVPNKSTNIIANFSDSIVDSTSSFLFSIENIDRNKRRKNIER